MSKPKDDHTLIDINVSYGTWPFQRFPLQSIADLASHLSDQGIREAFVSHLGGVFDPDAGPFNLELIDSIARLQDNDREQSGTTMHPVPVVNPVFPGWKDHLDACRSQANVRAVKIYPSFHNYSLSESEFVPPFVEYLRRNGLQLLVAMRLEDERTRYHGLSVVGVPVEDVISFRAQIPGFKFVCLNAYLPEAKRIGSEAPDVGVDISFVDWMFALEDLRKHVALDSIFFGSHSPFLYTGANILKLAQSRLSADEKQRIGALNAAAFLLSDSSAD